MVHQSYTLGCLKIEVHVFLQFILFFKENGCITKRAVQKLQCFKDLQKIDITGINIKASLPLDFLCWNDNLIHIAEMEFCSTCILILYLLCWICIAYMYNHRSIIYWMDFLINLKKIVCNFFSSFAEKCMFFNRWKN